MAFSPRNIVGCLLKKGLQRGGSRAPGTPLATPLCQYCLTYLCSFLSRSQLPRNVPNWKIKSGIKNTLKREEFLCTMWTQWSWSHYLKPTERSDAQCKHSEAGHIISNPLRDQMHNVNTVKLVTSSQTPWEIRWNGFQELPETLDIQGKITVILRHKTTPEWDLKLEDSANIEIWWEISHLKTKGL